VDRQRFDRRLSVVLAADVAGYSRLVAEDEEGALAILAAYKTTLSDIVTEHAGRIFGSAGDSLVVEFQSAVHGLRAAVAIQRALSRRNADLAINRRMEFRIGLHVGDVVVEEGNLLGDVVNVAARLQEAAQPQGICISGALRDQVEGRLEFPLVNLGERNLKNIPRPVAVHRVEWRGADPLAAGALGGPLSLPDKPSITVLPFVNMSGDPEQEFFADGLTEDIITALSQFRWFFVIARNSSFAYKNRAVDVKQIARELGVRYVLEGSVRKAGTRVRVSAQLIDAETSAHLCAERYDRDLADIFAIQDELTQHVVAAIEPEILMGESRRVLQVRTGSLDAYECHMRGMWYLNQQDTAAHFAESIDWHRRAIALDPGFSRAHMALARSLYACCLNGYSGDIERDRQELVAAAERAVALDDRDPYAHYALCLAHFLSQRQTAALAEAQRAIDLNPNFAIAHNALGWARIFVGHFAEAMGPLHTALRLSPHDPLAYLFLNRIALAHYHLGNYEEAVHFSERAAALRRQHFVLLVLLASYGQLARRDEAMALLPEVVAGAPADPEHYWQIVAPYADSAHRTQLFEGLAKAGLPGYC
jgi:adenylate cyclase